MNKTFIVSIVVAIVVLGGGYILFSGQETSPQQSAQTQKPVLQSPSTLTVRLNERNNSGETGTAKLSEKDEKLVVSLALTGAPEGVIQPAHIHVGSCPDVGAVKYPLTFPINGTSETAITISLADLQSGLPLAINVHKSATEVKTYVACGDLIFNSTILKM